MATMYQEPTGIARTDVGFLRRISWGAIFAGAIVALVIELLLSLLGLGIGLGTVNPATEENPLGGVGLGAGIWMAVSMLLALFAGGWVAAKLAGYPRSLTGILHGIVVWGVATLFSFYLMTSAMGMLVSGVFGVIGKGLTLVGSGVAAVAEQATRGGGGEDPMQSIMGQAKDILGKRAKTGVTAEDKQMTDAISKMFSTEQVTPEDRETVITMLTERTDMSRAEAEKNVDAWIQQRQQVAQSLQQAQGTALQVTEQTMDTLSKAAIWAFIALVLGGIAAAVGGALGAPKEIITTTARAAR